MPSVPRAPTHPSTSNPDIQKCGSHLCAFTEGDVSAHRHLNTPSITSIALVLSHEPHGTQKMWFKVLDTPIHLQKGLVKPASCPVGTHLLLHAPGWVVGSMVQLKLIKSSWPGVVLSGFNSNNTVCFLRVAWARSLAMVVSGLAR